MNILQEILNKFQDMPRSVTSCYNSLVAGPGSGCLSWASGDFAARRSDFDGLQRARTSEPACHGRIEQRRIEVLTPLPGLINCPHAAQILRVTRKRTDARRNGNGRTSVEHACAITSVPTERASPEELLAWNRGHWSVEVNHNARDTRFDEDACLARTGFAPENNAMCNNIAIALIIRRAGNGNCSRSIASATRHFALRRKDAFTAILSS